MMAKSFRRHPYRNIIIDPMVLNTQKSAGDSTLLFFSDWYHCTNIRPK